MTVSPIQAIQETTSTVAGQGAGEISASLAKTLKVLYWIHKIWRGTKTARAASNAPNFIAYLGGVGLNLAYGDRRGVKIAAQTVLIAMRVVEAIEHLVTLNLYFKEIKMEFCGDTILPLKPEWKHPGKVVFISHAFEESVRTGLITFKHRALRIVQLIGLIAYHILDLSMCIYDASKGFDIDNEHVSDNVNEIFLNAKVSFDKMTTDLPLLGQKLEEHSKVIDVLLSKMSNSPLKTSHLLKVCMAGARVIDGAEAAVEAIDYAANVAVRAVLPVLDAAPRFVDQARISPPLAI